MKTCPKCETQHSKPGTFCSRSCANSRTWTEEINRKRGDTLKQTFIEKGHPCTGRPGWKHDDEMKERKRKISIAYWDKIGRVPYERKLIQNRYTRAKYSARKRNQTPDDADLELIKEIYTHCPKGYEVDHIIAIAEGGLHHEDNLQYLPAFENRKKNRTQNYNRSLIIRWQDIIFGDSTQGECARLLTENEVGSIPTRRANQ